MTEALSRSIFLAALLAASPALAHVGVGPTSGFTAGLGHPLAGADHLLAMVAVGLWAGLVGGRALWVWPACFVGVMALGAIAGMAGFELPLVEPAILASVIVLGLVVALGLRAPLWLGAALAGGFALFHGHAHGTEAPETALGIAYLAGFAVATAALHGAGIALARAATRSPLSGLLLRGAGAAAALAGAALAMSMP